MVVREQQDIDVKTFDDLPGSDSVHREIHNTMNLSTHKMHGDRRWVVR